MEITLKILFINADGFFYNNSSTMQNMGIVYGLKELGAEVDLLSLQPQRETIGFDAEMQRVLQDCVNHEYFIPLNGLYQKLNKKKKHIVENIGHESTWISSLKGSIRRFIKSFLVFDLRILNLHNVNKVKIDLSQYDIIISASDPKSTHCIANYLVKKYHYKGRYIQYWGDPLYLDITRDRNILDRLCKLMEKRTLYFASKVVYATPFTLKEQMELYPEFANKMSWVHQAAISFGSKKKENNQFKNKISLVYCGDYRKETRNILPLYHAVKHFHDQFQLSIYGTSNFQLLSTDNIIVHGQVSRKEADRVEAEADVLVCICNLRGTQIPGKIYYLTDYDKPIIVIVDGNYKNELKKYFDDMKRFIVCENTENGIEEAIQTVRTFYEKPLLMEKDEFAPIHMAELIIAD